MTETTETPTARRVVGAVARERVVAVGRDRDAREPEGSAGAPREACAECGGTGYVVAAHDVRLGCCLCNGTGTVPAVACGASWAADYGPLPCALPHGHGGLHRCYGSQGPIDFGPLAAPAARPPETD